MKINILRFLRKQKRAVGSRVTLGKKFEDADPTDVSKEQILQDMHVLQPHFDLRDPAWRTDEGAHRFLNEFFDKTKNYTTDDIRVPEIFRQWMMGQTKALRKLDLIMAEYLKQVQDEEKIEEQEAQGIEQSMMLKQRPSIIVLLEGEAGTGKSLYIKIAAEAAKEMYAKNNIKMALIMTALGSLIAVGAGMMALGFRDLVLNVIGGMSVQMALANVGQQF